MCLYFCYTVIEEANWLTLEEDLADKNIEKGTFDAVLCLGNSFAHLPDVNGDHGDHIKALKNFRNMLKPGIFVLHEFKHLKHIKCSFIKRLN